MNRVTMVDPSGAKPSVRDERYINLYTVGALCGGGPHNSEKACREARYGNSPGLIIKVTRDENGDFTIQKVAEF